MGGLAAGGWPLSAAVGILAAAGAAAAWRWRAVTASGAAGVGIMGVTIAAIGGPMWLLPVLLFFIISVLLGRLDNDIDEHGARTFGQVAANGAIAWLGVLLLLLADAPRWSARESALVYVGAIAAATADTWATEVGTRFGGNAYDIITGRDVRHGTSGGVTGVGSAAAAVGAVVIALTLPLLEPSFSGDWKSVGSVAVCGWVGMVADSVVGSSIQKRYRCTKCRSATESPIHCDRRAVQVSGPITNSQVNWICTATGALAAWLWIG